MDWDRCIRHEISASGKTGTTNDFTDAWFIGFSPSITTWSVDRL